VFVIEILLLLDFLKGWYNPTGGLAPDYESPIRYQPGFVTYLVDDLVGADEDGLGDGDAQGLGGFQIHREDKRGRLLDW